MKDYFKNNKLNLFFLFLTVVSLVATAIFVFTYGQAYVHSDTAIANRYGWSMHDNHSLFPESWIFVNSEIYVFRVTSLAALITPFFSNQIFARMLATFIFILITAAGIIYCSRRLFKSNFWMAAIPIFFIFLGGAESRNMILTEGTYMSEMLGIVLCTTLMYTIYTKLENSWPVKEMFFYGIIVFLMTLGGMRYFAEQVLPMMFASFAIVFIACFFKKKIEKELAVRRFLIMFFTILIPSGLGYGTYKWLCSWHMMNAGRTDSLRFVGTDMLVPIFKSAIITLYNCFGYTAGAKTIGLTNARNVVSIVSCTLICFVIPILQLIRIKKEDEAVQFFSLFGFAHNAALMSVVVLFGKCMERYVLSTIYVCIIVSCNYIWARFIENKGAIAKVIVALFAMAIFVESAFLLSAVPGYKGIIDSHKRVVAELENRGIKKGYGSYWTSYMYETYADGKIRFGEVDVHGIRMDGWLWNNDGHVYDIEDGKSCLVLTESESEAAQDYLSSYIAPPIERFVIPGAYYFDCYSYTYQPVNLVVYVYDFDLAIKISDGIADGKISVRDSNNNGCVYADDNDTFIFFPCGVIKGPYSIVEKGNYTVKIKGHGVETLFCEFTSEQNQEAITAKNHSITESAQIWSLSLSDTVEDFCIVISSGKEGGIVVDEISIEKR